MKTTGLEHKRNACFIAAAFLRGADARWDPCPILNPAKDTRSCKVFMDCPCAPKADWWNTCVVCGDVFARVRNLTSA